MPDYSYADTTTSAADLVARIDAVLESATPRPWFLERVETPEGPHAKIVGPSGTIIDYIIPERSAGGDLGNGDLNLIAHAPGLLELARAVLTPLVPKKGTRTSVAADVITERFDIDLDKATWTYTTTLMVGGCHGGIIRHPLPIRITITDTVWTSELWSIERHEWRTLLNGETTNPQVAIDVAAGVPRAYGIGVADLTLRVIDEPYGDGTVRCVATLIDPPADDTTPDAPTGTVPYGYVPLVGAHIKRSVMPPKSYIIFGPDESVDLVRIPAERAAALKLPQPLGGSKLPIFLSYNPTPFGDGTHEIAGPDGTGLLRLFGGAFAAHGFEISGHTA